ncbi:putative cell division cycle protein [Trypanosoma rangeli]|uniref:Putative cell division cycle protein n=1 Tax=Trypanosoma rangeli TaxID=5698 RepID=A0A3R7NWG6_TRYRA|nr:putative cell division cycle protein [Trypanosoma rangeli]RNF08802.1 putative cell division cycle protein [Trypanosoma rangeli]|eukprot:RNF08802.1 putative cell division cycle protein [Trypanosoma rangeli]
MLMRGGTGLLVLAAPLMWWPSVEELHHHPLDARRTFFSAITNAGVAVGAADRLVGLSRLGTSVMFSGVLDGASVRVYDPFSGAEVTLAVRTAPSEHALASGASLQAIAEADRVRIEAMAVETAVELRPLAEAGNALCERHTAAAVRHILHYLRRARRSGVCSVLFTGEHGVGKTHTMQHVAQQFPPVVDVQGVKYVLERRDLSVARLLQLNEREAVTVLRRIFAVPPVASPNGTDAVLLLLTLDAADLLWADANSLVALVSHQLCSLLEELREPAGAAHAHFHVVLLATASTTTSLPTTLLTRLSSRVVHVAPPSLQERQRYIDRHSASSSFPPEVRQRVAELLAGYTAGQLVALQAGDMLLQTLEREAARGAKQREFEENQEQEARLDAYRGLIGLDAIVRDLEEFVVWPLLHLQLLRRCGVMAPKGVVVCGPAGSGKTALLTALARRLRSESARGVHVMLVDGLALIEKEVGRTEKNIAALFATARAMSPTALFLDNIDSLAPPRGQHTSEVSNTADRTLSTLLTEMDGISNRHCDGDVVFVVASAPYFAALDPAIGRPGRLDLRLEIPLPTAAELRDHVVRRVMSCVVECGGSDATGDAGTVSALVEAHVARWMNARRVTVAEANAFVREVALHMLEPSPCTPLDRLRETLQRATGS